MASNAVLSIDFKTMALVPDALPLFQIAHKGAEDETIGPGLLPGDLLRITKGGNINENHALILEEGSLEMTFYRESLSKNSDVDREINCPKFLSQLAGRLHQYGRAMEM